MVDLVLIDGHDHHAVVLEEAATKSQAALHEGQPHTRAPRVVGIDVVVVVGPVLVAGVVWRVEVEHVDLAPVGGQQRLDRVVVLALDDDVARPVGGTVADRAERGQRRVDGLGEGLLHEHVGTRQAEGRGVGRRGRVARLGDQHQFVGLDGPHAEAARHRGPALPDHRPHPDGRDEEAGGLQAVAFEDEAPGDVLLQLGHFQRERLAQGWVGDLADEVIDKRHEDPCRPVSGFVAVLPTASLGTSMTGRESTLALSQVDRRAPAVVATGCSRGEGRLELPCELQQVWLAAGGGARALRRSHDADIVSQDRFLGAVRPAPRPWRSCLCGAAQSTTSPQARVPAGSPR